MGATVIGENYRMPTFVPSTAASFQGAIAVARLHDTAISKVPDTPASRIARLPEASVGKARLWIVRRSPAARR